MSAATRLQSLRAGSITSVLSAVVSAAALFLMFKLFVWQTSTAAIGCWSLIQGLFLFSRIADVGVGSNFTRLVALNSKAHLSIDVRKTVLAGLLLSTIPVILIGAVIVIPIYDYVVTKSGATLSSADVFRLVVSAFLFAALNSSSTICLSILEGMGKIAHRNVLSIVSNLSGLFCAYPLVRSFGVAGIGYTSVVQGAVLLLLGLYAARADLESDPRNELLSFRGVIRTIWTDNFRMSAIGLLRLSFEPTSKLILSQVSPLETVAFFELALRITTQIRITYQAAIAPLLSFGSRAKSDPLTNDLMMPFAVANRATSIISIAASAVQLAFAPLLSLAAFGRIQQEFISYFEVLVVANCLNSFGIVGYYFQLSGGHLSGLVAVHAVMAMINLIGGVGLAYFLGALGVILAYGLAFSAGGVACAIMFHRALGLNKTLKINRTSVFALVQCALAGLFASSALALMSIGTHVFITGSVIMSILAVSLFAFVLWHEVFVRIWTSSGQRLR